MTVAIDANIFIYALEANEKFGPTALALLKAVEGGQIKAVASELVYLELLSGKLLTVQDVEKIKKMLSLSGTKLYPVDRTVLLEAAALRRQLGLSTPAAIHLSGAIQAGADTFVTNDRQILKSAVKSLKILALQDATRFLNELV
jgi:predicted nucleic acid-binding protein